MWYRTISCDIGRLWYHSQTVISYYDIICIPSLYHTMISHMISWFSDYDIIIMWYHSQTMISHFELWYHMWCHRCISCDVNAYHMWCHIVISQCDITIMWYHRKILWYHMWNHRQKRGTSYVISYSFFHITPWYHMWYHGMLIYDITVWYHIVMSYVMSHPWRWPKPPARRLWLPKVQPPRGRQRPEARTPSQHQPPRRRSRLCRRRRLHQELWRRPCFWKLARWQPTPAAKTAAQQAAASVEYQCQWSRKIRPCAKEILPIGR